MEPAGAGLWLARAVEPGGHQVEILRLLVRSKAVCWNLFRFLG